MPNFDYLSIVPIKFLHIFGHSNREAAEQDLMSNFWLYKLDARQ